MDKKELQSKRILILGNTGQLGKEISHKLKKKFDVLSLSKKDCDISDEKNLKQFINNYLPNIIINCGAYTNVEKAEKLINHAFKVNSSPLDTLGKLAKKIGAMVIHFSSDYIFDGKKKSSYSELDRPDPINVYGKSKLQGEKNLIKQTNKYLIFRTSWVYSANGKNFFKTIISLFQNNREVKIISDQYGIPTSVYFVSNIVEIIINKYFQNEKNFVFGIYNLVPDGNTSWYEFAKEIFKNCKNYGMCLSCNYENIKSCKTKDLNYLAKRPKNSILNNSYIKQTFNLNFENWKMDVKKTLKILNKKKNEVKTS